MFSVENIASSFDGFGKVSSLNSQFKFTVTPWWINPIMSPYFVKNEISSQELKKYKSFLKRKINESPYNTKLPYIVAFEGKGQFNQKKVDYQT